MVGALFDTNILIDYLNGVGAARQELARYDSRGISIISWMEVMVGAGPEVAQQTKAFLAGFEIIALDGAIASRSVDLRRSHRLKLPDAIIWATAQVTNRLLVTRNTKDFAPSEPGVRMPYTI